MPSPKPSHRDRVRPKDLSDDYIVFMPTSTPEKVYLYQQAADAAGWPIQFRQMQDLVDAFHIIDEVESDYAGNANEKLREAEKIIRQYKEGKAGRLIDLCENKWGIRFRTDHIIFAADDSGMDGPPGAWEKMGERGDYTGVSQSTLDKIAAYLLENDGINGDGLPKGGAGTELSPVMSAMLGQTEYMRRMSNTLREMSEADPGRIFQFVEHSTMSIRKLSDDAMEDPISCTTALAYQPRPAPDTDIKTCWHYLKPQNPRKGDEDKTAAELGLDYVAHYSPRRKIVDRFATEVLGLTEEDKNRYRDRDKTKYKDNRRKLADPDQPFQVACVGFDSRTLPESSLGKPFNFSAEQSARTSAHEALGVVEDLLKKNDAFVLRPDHALKDADRFRKYYTLFSMVVAKLLVGRDMNKPIIIQNHNGCWDDAIKMHRYLVKKSMTRDFNFTPAREGLPEDKNRFTNGYFDVISGHDLADINARTQQLLDWHREHYEKRNPVNGEPQSKAEGEAPPQDLYKVAVFLSAGNENDDLNKDTYQFCHDLALKGFGMITGGGDRYAMGAAYEGYFAGQKEIEAGQRNTRTWSGAFSTQILLDAETKEGKFAEGYNYTKCCADIYERMAGMLEASDTVVVRAGGAGTMEEWMAFLVLKQQFPEKMADKNIIIYDPTVFKTDDKPFYEPILEPVLGQYYDAIMGHRGEGPQRAASAEMGIYVVDSNEKIMDLLDKFETEKRHPSSAAERPAMQRTGETGPPGR